MDSFSRDVRQGLRALLRNPSVTAVAIVALALGIGANTAIFTAVNAVLLRPLPYPDEDRLVQIWGSTPSRGVPFHNVFYSDVVQWREQSRSFESIVACSPESANLIQGNEPERITLWRVNAGYFPLLGARPAYGRGFLPAEDTPGAPRVVVLSYGLWQRRFGSDAKIVGSAVNLDGTLHSVVGVVPADFRLIGRNIDAYTPLALPDVRDPRQNETTVVVFARLRPGIVKQKAQSEMDGIGYRMGQQNPSTLGRYPRVWGLREFVVRDVRLSLLVLLAAVGLVLMIACVNVANLLLARAAARQKEIAIRASLGATQGRLIRQLLTESGLLGLVGGACGVLLAQAGVKALPALVPERYPLLKDAAIDGRVLLFTLAVSMITGVVFGLAPAMLSSRAGDLTNALKEGGRGSESSTKTRLLSLLACAEVALALVLLVGAGLLIRSFQRLNEVKPGFNARGVLTASVNLPRSKYGQPTRRVEFFKELIGGLQSIPGVQAAGVVSALPLTQYNTGTGLWVEGRPQPRPGEFPIVWFRIASAGYFRVMEIPLIKGRMFTERDDTSTPPVAIINETMARRYWPNEDPVGNRFTTGAPPSGQPPTWMTIVGVVGDLRHKNLNEEPDAEFFWPYQQPPFGGLTVTVRTQADPLRFAPLLREAVASIDKEQPASQIRSMAQIVEDSIAPQRLAAVLLGVFASVALILAAVGIYGVVSFSVTRRTQEIGVRMALGARAVDVLRMVIGQTLAVALAGVIVGLAGAFALTRVIGSLLYGVSATDPLIFAGVSLLLTAIAALAGYLPARRASRVDPLVALRYE